MTDKNKKTIILNTLILCFCVIVVALFCIIPNKKLDEDIIDIYTISFNGGEGISYDAIEVKEGENISLPENPTREGYIFVGWMLGDEPFDPSKEITGDITLTAKWKKIDETKKYYTVYFNTDGGTAIANQVLEEGEHITRPENPTKDGYEFVRWEVNGVEYNFDTPVTSDITIIAIYNQTAVEPEQPETPQEKTYRVTFNAGGGSFVSGCGAQNVKEGARARNTCNVTRPGFNFAGWTPDINTTINSNTTFTATWQERARTFVSFDLNGGTGSCPIRDVYVGDALNVANICNPQRAHYTFGGWELNSNVVTSVTPSGPTTLRARWNVAQHRLGMTELKDETGTTVVGVKFSIANYPDSSIEYINICSYIAAAGTNKCTTLSSKNNFRTNGTIYNDVRTCEVKFNGINEKFTCTR